MAAHGCWFVHLSDSRIFDQDSVTQGVALLTDTDLLEAKVCSWTP
jgi:hypothetical protein